MEKPKDYAIYVNKNCTIPYKDWPQEVKDYKNWKRRIRSKPEWANLSEEERKKERGKILVQVRAKWKEKYESMSEKEKEEVNRKKGNHFNNATVEEKRKKSEELRQRSLGFWNSMSQEERDKFGRYRWELKSKEEREKISKRFNEAGQKYMRELPIEKMMERINHMNQLRAKKMEEDSTFQKEQIELLRKHCREFWNNLTEEQQQEISQKRSEFWKNAPTELLEHISESSTKRNHEWWDSRTPEQLVEISNRMREWNRVYWSNREHRVRHSQKAKERWESMTDDEKKEFYHSWIIGGCRSKLHDRFISYFYESYISNEYMIQEEYVCIQDGISHSWDFAIFNKNGTLQMLVDLDGAYYHADINDYNGYHSQEEYDERRFLTVPDGVKYHIIYEMQFTKSFEEMIQKLMIDYDKFVEDQFKYCR